MLRRPVLMVFIVLFVIPLTALAQTKGADKGQYTVVSGPSKTIALPDSQTVQQTSYVQITFSDDPNSPLNNISSNCIMTTVISKSGEVVANAGFCLSTDADGDGTWFWWRQEEEGTENCPNGCGSWGYYDGFGKFAGITGGGTWKSVATFPNGTITGVWEGSYEMK